MKTQFIVHKFGGSSLINAESFKTIHDILKIPLLDPGLRRDGREEGKNDIIVVSAIKETTSILQQALDNALEKKEFKADLTQLKNTHLEIIKNLIPNPKLIEIHSVIEDDFTTIINIMNTVMQISSYSKEIQDFILGYGEQWSAKILTEYLSITSQTIYLDSTKVLRTTLHQNMITIDWKKSSAFLTQYLENNKFEQLVITGFIASTEDGRRTTLGRNGSDFSASVFAKLFQAKALFIWKDVDGIYTANPKIVLDAFPIESLSYKEALELAYFGAKVIHPRTIAPAQSENIPIYIKNCAHPKSKGTEISNSPQKTTHPVRGVTSIDDVALINIEGAGMIGVSGIAARIFDIIQRKNISVILISQASSEYSICFAVANEFADLTLKILNESLQFEIEKHQIDKITVDKECSILAVVGDGMIGTVGVSGRIFATLAKANINIHAIAQGSSERNISLVINKRDSQKALKAVHSGFYLSHKTISIGLIGVGTVGKALLSQIHNASHQLKLKYQVDLSVRGIMNSKKMILSQKSISLLNYSEELNEALPADIKLFSDHIASDSVPHALIIDCTADPKIAGNYIDFIEKGIHIITPNKHANGGDLNFYKKLKSIAQQKNCQYFYEATVCAGLPIINTLQDIIKSGDEVHSIEGIMSGTLSYIFTELSKGKLFSETILEAKKLGYTEPDPKIDLSGQDVARKLICLSREIGLDVSMKDIIIPDLISINDVQMASMVADANAKKEKICYVGSILHDGTVQINLKSYPQDHPFSRLNGTDNMIIFHTKRYHQQPLVIQGPGAGAEVTAAGIFADLLRLASSLS